MSILQLNQSLSDPLCFLFYKVLLEAHVPWLHIDVHKVHVKAFHVQLVLCLKDEFWRVEYFGLLIEDVPFSLFCFSNSSGLGLSPPRYPHVSQKGAVNQLNNSAARSCLT